MAKLKEANILITGGACSLGSFIVEKLAKEKPASITALDNFSTGTPRNISYARDHYPQLRFHELNTTHTPRLNKVLAEKVDVCINLVTLPLMASYDDAWKVWDNNLDTIKNLLEFQRQDKIGYLVHVSSSEAYGEMLENPMSESHPLNPTTVYGVSKAAEDILIETFHRMYGARYLIPRLFNLYGERQWHGPHSGVIPRTVQTFMKGKPLTIYSPGTQSRDYTYIVEVADAIVQLVKHGGAVNRTINICSGRSITIRYLLQLIALKLRYNGKIGVEPNPRPNDAQQMCGDPSLLKSLISWKPSSLEDKLSQVVEWYLEVLEGTTWIKQYQKQLEQTPLK